MSKANPALLEPTRRPRGKAASRAIVEELRSAIVSGRLQPGQRVESVRELALRHGTSVNTVVAAIGELVQDRLVERRRGMGIYVLHGDPVLPRPSAARATRTVVMLVDSEGHFYSQFASTLVRRLTHDGLTPIVCHWVPARSQEVLGRLRAQWREQPPFAVVNHLLNPASLAGLRPDVGPDALLIDTFHRLAEPDDRIDAAGIHRVAPDYLAAYSMVVQALLDLGHRRIGFTTYRRSGSPFPRKRSSGNAPAILTLGHALRNAGIRGGLTINYETTNFDVDSDHPVNIDRYTRWFQGSNRPTAVFGDDIRVAAARTAALRVGLSIPKDLLLVGQYNTPWSQALGFPSVDYQPDVLAVEVADIISRASSSNSAGPPQRILVPPRLVWR